MDCRGSGLGVEEQGTTSQPPVVLWAVAPIICEDNFLTFPDDLPEEISGEKNSPEFLKTRRCSLKALIFGAIPYM